MKIPQELIDKLAYVTNPKGTHSNYLNTFKNNQYFLTNSNLRNRLVPELTYIYYDFDRRNSKHWSYEMGGTKDWGYNTDGLTRLFTINTIDISIPGTSQNFIQQNIFNVIKNYPISLDSSTKNTATMKIIESSTLEISKVINFYLYLNNNPGEGTLTYYPDSLKFNVYVFPLVMDGDIETLRFASRKPVIILDGCQFIGFNDWDFDLSGNKAEIVTKSVTINYEKKYVTD